MYAIINTIAILCIFSIAILPILVIIIVVIIDISFMYLLALFLPKNISNIPFNILPPSNGHIGSKLNIISNEGFKLSEFLITSERTVINKKCALFIVPKMEDSNNEIVKMIIAEVYQICKNQSWFFILDNFDMIGDMNNFKGMFLSSIYRNIYMVIGTRDLDGLVNKYGKEILDVCDVLDSKDLNGSNMDKMNADFKMAITDLKADLPILKKSEVKTFDILKAMSE